MSEFYLKPENRRHWNLLKGAHEAGVHLVINETILGELISHFQMITNKYEDHYKHEEDVYINDEIMTLYIDEIMIRAYFYERMRGNVLKFGDFIDNFVSPNLADADRELKAWLKEEFGIDFVSDASICVSINAKEEEKLIEVLRKYKSVRAKG